MSERDLSRIWFNGERERNISGAFALAVSDWAESTPTKRNIERSVTAAPLRSHALLLTDTKLLNSSVYCSKICYMRVSAKSSEILKIKNTVNSGIDF